MDFYDVVIVGAGGAGLITARTLGDLGFNVLLVDRKSDLLNLPFKTLGSFIDLDKFNLSKNVIASEISQNIIYSKHFKCTSSGQAYILDKVKLHSELIDTINKDKVKILVGTTISEVQFDESNNILAVVDDNRNIYKGKIFVDATGITGLLSKKVGIQDVKMNIAVGLEYNVKYLGSPNETHLFIGNDFEGGYAWIFPLKNSRAILGIGSFENLVIKDLKIKLNNMFSNKIISKLVEKDNDNAEGGTIPITAVKRNFVQNNLVCIGDSVSQVNPAVGEGYRYIFESSRIASNAISKSLVKNDNSLLKEYDIKWYEKYYQKYIKAKRLQKLINRLSKNDLLIDLGLLFLKTKRNTTIEKLLKGEITSKTLYLP